MKTKLRQMVKVRSKGICEVIIESDKTKSRCNNQAVDIHHMLTKARGGGGLDNEEEIYHLIHLCRKHHSMCDGQEAYDGGLLIDGYVLSKNGKTIYFGTDEYLRAKYGDNSEPEAITASNRPSNNTTPRALVREER